MALFDKINSRYTKSMADGGSYERDAALGGYDRKELRGLGKQAKRGTLTQRERARYNYLKDERGGRRKRGLLSGLGGAGAVLAGLAASGKLGGGAGGAGAAGLMDMIKGKLAGVQEKKLLKNISKDQMNAAMSGDIPAIGDYDPMSDIQDIPLEEDNVSNAFDEEYSSNMQIPPELRDTPGADLISDSMNPPTDSFAPNQFNDAQEVLDLFRSSSNMKGRLDELQGGASPEEIGASQKFPGGMSDKEASAEMKGRLKQDPHLRRLLKYGKFNKGGKVDEGSVKGLLSRLSKTEAYNIDPENLTTGDIPPEAFLNHMNKARLGKGLPEVDRITNQAINDILNMKPLRPKQPSQIFNRYR